MFKFLKKISLFQTDCAILKLFEIQETIEEVEFLGFICDYEFFSII